MERFSIITNRKRAIIALVHSAFFLAVAAIQLAVSRATAFSLHGGGATSGIILLSVYVIVTTVLLILLQASRSAKERLYFALCASSAAFGLVRIILGDPVLHANVLRVLFLTFAVLVGSAILRSHSGASAERA